MRGPVPDPAGRGDKVENVSDAAQRRDELKAVWEQASTCQRCPQLASTRQTVVFGAGNADADLMFVGEAPGAREDERGLPFVGQAGRLLDQLLGEIGLERVRGVHREHADVPPAGQSRPAAAGDRQLPGLPVPQARADPAQGRLQPRQLLDEAAARRPHGHHAAARARAEIRTIGPRTLRLYPIFHPAAALYTPRMLETLREDFARLPELLALDAPAQPEPAAPPEPAVPEPELAAVAAEPGAEPAPPDDDAQLGLF